MLGRSIYYLLSEATDLTDLIGLKIYPVEAPQGLEEAFLVYGISDTDPKDDKLQTSPEDWVTSDIVVYAKNYDLVHEISKEVRNALDGQSGLIAGNTISQIRFLNYSDAWEKERQSYVGVMEFQIIAAP